MRLTVLFAFVLLVAAACGEHAQPASWFRITGESGIGPTLTLQDISRSSVTVDSDPASGQPVVYFRLTPSGQTKFERLTRALARRGAAANRPFHFAITVDGRLLERPYIDYRVNPDGIPADSGIQLDVSSRAKAAALAKRLGGG